MTLAQTASDTPLAEATRLGVLDATTHRLAVDALVDHWDDDDPRWILLDRDGHAEDRDTAPIELTAA